MKFALGQWKIEQLVGYFNDDSIDLTPPFQRGRVWPRAYRKGLIKNILQGKPVPAIFLYKTQQGSKNVYVILDGKQRLESILLYVAAERSDFKIPQWTSYIYGEERDVAGYSADVMGQEKGIKDLTDKEVVGFRDYSLSIIEIELTEETTLEEIIQLFVDINQYFIKVSRFSIVKALYLKDPLLKQVFRLIAIPRSRGKDATFKLKKNPFAYVLKKLDSVSRAKGSQNQIDLMWERLCEVALYACSLQHRKPSEILKDFISRKASDKRQPKLNAKQASALRQTFITMWEFHKELGFERTRWVTDQTHFYTLITFMLKARSKSESLPSNFVQKLMAFDSVLAGNATPVVEKKVRNKVEEYAGLSTKQTTDSAKREKRGGLFGEIIQNL